QPVLLQPVDGFQQFHRAAFGPIQEMGVYVIGSDSAGRIPEWLVSRANPERVRFKQPIDKFLILHTCDPPTVKPGSQLFSCSFRSLFFLVYSSHQSWFTMVPSSLPRWLESPSVTTVKTPFSWS